MSKPARERFTLVLEALPDATPPVVRLRRFLKAALRSWKLRCVSVCQADPPTPKDAMTATTRTDAMLTAALDDLARNLDRVAGVICDIGPDERERVLARLQRLAADVGALVDELGRDTARGEPSLSH